MYLGIPQLIYMALLMLNIGGNLVRHGEQKITKYNFWSSLISGGIAMCILYAGGFFGKY